MKKNIAVVGSDGKISEKVKKIAERIGGDIAKNNCVLVCGGRGGVMEAACRGAKLNGGLTVGILPVLGKSVVNDFVDVVLPTGLGYARNALVVASADAVIAVCGGVGTLSEIALALSYGKPVFVVEGSGGVADSVQKEFEKEGGKIIVRSVRAEFAVSEVLRIL